MRMSSSIKKINHSKIYHMIYRESKGVSKQEIMRRLGLSLPTVTQKLEELQAEVSCRMPAPPTAPEAPGPGLFHSKGARLAVGLDINQDYYTAVLVDLLGSVICSKRQRFPFSQSDDYYRQIGLAVLELIDSVNADHQRVLGVGMGVPGLITKDRERGILRKNPRLWREPTCREVLQIHSFSLRVLQRRQGRGLRGAVEPFGPDRRLLHSAEPACRRGHDPEPSGGAGREHPGREIGHMTMIPFGKACYCGRSGCLEPYCSSAVLSELAEGDLDLFFRSAGRGIL